MMIIVLFGRTGAGKNYIGNLLEKTFGFYFFDGDALLPADMQKAISNKELFTNEMRSNLTILLIEKITLLEKQYDKVVIAQALYKEENRLKVQTNFPSAIFVEVVADSEIIRKRLLARNNLIDTDYANKIQDNYENPKLPHFKLFNNFDENNIIEQLKSIFEKIKNR